jgi:hypothetical protein
VSNLYFQYGNFQHPPGEVYPSVLEIRPVFSERGIRWASDVHMTIEGSFCSEPSLALGPDEISDRIMTLNAVYGQDYQDFGFYRTEDGSETPHLYINDDPFNLSGNRVTSRSWTYKSPAEYANTRSYSITLAARYLDEYSQVLFFTERVSQVGTGGPSWQFKQTWNTLPVKEVIHQYTKVRLIQEGMIIGSTLSIQPPPPWWPDDEHEDERMIVRESPRLHGHLSFAKPTHFVTRYRYVFERAISPNRSPHIWWQ